MKDEYDNECHYDFKNIMFKLDNDEFYYTFTCEENNNKIDASLNHLKGIYYMYGWGDTLSCSCNKIGAYHINTELGEYAKGILKLPHNVFYNTGVSSQWHNNILSDDCYKNIFKEGCFNNVLGKNCYENVFNNFSRNNVLGANCYKNTFNGYNYNNILGNDCNNITIQKNYVSNIIVENGNQYITLTSTQETTSSSVLRNITIAQGVNNTTTVKTISHNTVNDTIKTIYCNDSSGNTVSVNIADISGIESILVTL